MKLHYLGTAAAEGIPAVWCNCEVCKKIRKTRGKDVRTRSQVLINDDLMVDFPQDSYMHMLQNDLEFYKLKYVIFTHSHQDHFYPEEFAMRSEGYAAGIEEPVHVYGNNVCIDRLKMTAELDEGGRVILHELKNFEPVQIGDYLVTPLTARHDPRENCLIYSIESDGKRLLYSNDTGEYPEETWDYIEQNHLKFDLLSMDCTIGMKDSKDYHMGYPNILKMKERFEKNSLIDEHTKIIATHYSHNFYLPYAELQEIMEKDHIIPSYDGMQVEI